MVHIYVVVTPEGDLVNFLVSSKCWRSFRQLIRPFRTTFRLYDWKFEDGCSIQAIRKFVIDACGCETTDVAKYSFHWLNNPNTLERERPIIWHWLSRVATLNVCPRLVQDCLE